MRGPEEVKKILKKLRGMYPEAACALHHSNPLELLIATILSAQCTDARVNQVTPPLFKKYRTARDWAGADRRVLEQEIRTTGFYRNKAASIQNCCALLEEKHGGRVPGTLEELVELPGVGRKTANVVLGVAFGVASGVVVDTHVKRISFRLGLTRQTNPEKVELDLMRQIPKKDWTSFPLEIILHGRKICKALKPACAACALEALCPKVGVAWAKGSKVSK
ncbi:MAG: endonuclease III [bacterium]